MSLSGDELIVTKRMRTSRQIQRCVSPRISVNTSLGFQCPQTMRPKFGWLKIPRYALRACNGTRGPWGKGVFWSFGFWRRRDGW
jgi:hypothetical protein